jgi:hypothetical protein
MFRLLRIFGQSWGEPWYGKNAGRVQGLTTGPHHIQLLGATFCLYLGAPRRLCGG